MAAASAPDPRSTAAMPSTVALSNCTNTPVEATDMDFEHFRIVGYGLIPDTGGAGRHRGGLGLFRRFEILKDDTNFASYTDRVRIAP